MGNPRHIDVLKQGGNVWNKWRADEEGARPDLSGLKLPAEAHLAGLDLRSVNLRKATLAGADLGITDLGGADLSGADLHGARFSGTSFIGADLTDANLSGARISWSAFGRGHLGVPEFLQTWPKGTVLYRTNVFEAEMTDCIFTGVDLSQVKGLESVRHRGSSSLDIETIYRSKGKISDSFLRGAGVPEPFIVNMRALVAAMEPIQFYSCFISYSSQDQAFAERLHADLRSKNLRCWFAPEDLVIGDRFQERIEESIRLHDKLMIVLSEASVQSRWVEREVNAAREREDREKRVVLFPIRIDDGVMDTSLPWAADIRRTRHIGDFRQWKDHDSYQSNFERLLRDLKADASGEVPKTKST